MKLRCKWFGHDMVDTLYFDGSVPILQCARCGARGTPVVDEHVRDLSIRLQNAYAEVERQARKKLKEVSESEYCSMVHVVRQGEHEFDFWAHPGFAKVEHRFLAWRSPRVAREVWSDRARCRSCGSDRGTSPHGGAWICVRCKSKELIP